MIEHCENELLATVLVNAATVVRMPTLPQITLLTQYRPHMCLHACM